MRNRSNKETVLLLILILIMVMSLNLAVLDSTGMNISVARLALYSFGAAAAAVAAVVFPLILLIYAGVIGITTLFIYYSHAEILNYMGTFLYDFFNWLPGYIIGNNPFDDRFALVFSLLYIILSVLIITLLASWKKGSILLIVLGTATITFFWFIYVERAKLYLMLFLFAAVMLHSYRVFKSNMAKWEKENCRTSSNVEGYWLLNSGIIIAAAMILALMLPVNIDPLRWDWLNNKVISAFPFLMEWRNDTMESNDYGFASRYGISKVGYRTRKLGGPITLDKSVMLNIKSNGSEALYLRGTVKEKYTGNSWQKANKKYMTVKPGNHIYLSGAEDAMDGRPEKLIITPRKLLTSTIMAPYRLTNVYYQSNCLYIDSDSEAYFPKLVTRNETYTVESSIPYIDEDKLRKAGTDKNIPYAYFQLPDSITYRTKQLADNITADCKNDYDRAKAIESYLRSHYKYNLKPGQPPVKKEFVDYFLFEGKEGYCTYFATAMAVLLRSSDIPCRYVEGFLLKENGTTDRDITGEEAHAWIEVYFNDYGWVTFEATPAYPVVRYVKPKETAAAVEVTPTPAVKAEDVEAMSTARRNRDLDIDEEADTTGPAQKNNTKLHIGMIIWAIIGLLTLRIIYLATKRMIFEAFMRKYKDKSYAIKYIKDVIWYIRKIGLKQETDDTFREYMKKADIHLKGDLGDISRITGIVEKARYSQSGITESEKSEIEAFRRKIREIAIYRVGFLRMYFSWYFIGR